MKKYYIYHIPTFVHKDGTIGKIGCTEQQANKRTKKQGYTEYEILETHTDIMIASDREIELQKEHGYPVDKIPYYKSSKISTKEGRLKGGKSALESGQFYRFCSAGGKATAKTRDSEFYSKMAKIAGKIAVESGQLDSIRSKENSSKGGKANKLKTYTCCYCNKTGSFLGMIRWHGERCKHKPTST